MSRAGSVMRALCGRRVLAMADQAVSSLSNVVVTVIVARMVTSEAFGAFSVALIAYQLALGAVRATTGEPFLSAHSADEAGSRDRAAADCAFGAFGISLVASAVMLVAALALGGLAAGPLVALGLAFPLLGVQDALRHVAVVDRPQLALASDLAWLVLVVAILVMAPAGVSAAWYVGAWGVSGVAALAVAAVTLRLPLAAGSARRWVRRHRAMAGAFLAETAAARAASQAVVLLLGPIAGGMPAIGAVRAAQVFYGPLNTMFSGIYLALVPDGGRQRDDPRRLLRSMARASAVVVTASVAWLLVGMVLPDRYGEALFGATWAKAEPVMVPMGLGMVGGAIATGAFAGVRSLGDARTSLRARIASLPPELVLGPLGAFIGGATGYAYGFAAARSMIAGIWWSSFLGSLFPDRSSPLERQQPAGRPTGGPVVHGPSGRER